MVLIEKDKRPDITEMAEYIDGVMSQEHFDFNRWSVRIESSGLIDSYLQATENELSTALGKVIGSIFAEALKRQLGSSP